MIVQQQRAHSGVSHRLLQERIGHLVIVEAHHDSRVQEKVSVSQRLLLAILLRTVSQDSPSPEQIQLLEMLVVSVPSCLVSGNVCTGVTTSQT